MLYCPGARCMKAIIEAKALGFADRGQFVLPKETVAVVVSTIHRLVNG